MQTERENPERMRPRLKESVVCKGCERAKDARERAGLVSSDKKMPEGRGKNVKRNPKQNVLQDWLQLGFTIELREREAAAK